MQWPVPSEILVFEVRIAARINEARESVDASISRRQVYRRFPFLVRGMDVRSMIQQRLRDPDVSVSAGDMQRCLSVGISVVSYDSVGQAWDSGLEEEPCAPFLARCHRRLQRRLTKICMGVIARASM